MPRRSSHACRSCGGSGVITRRLAYYPYAEQRTACLSCIHTGDERVARWAMNPERNPRPYPYTHVKR